jgi:hypothetical protein
MRRLTVHLAVALLTFIIGIAVSSLSFTFRQVPQDKRKVQENRPRLLPTTTEKSIVSSRSIARDGVESSYSTSEKYSDGTCFNQTSVFYSSPARASRELQKRLEDAVGIIKQEPVTDKEGHQVGERVLATFAPYKGASVVSAELLLTRGSEFIYTRGSSVDKMLEESHPSQPLGK